jgi:hypothetical protein
MQARLAVVALILLAVAIFGVVTLAAALTWRPAL